MTARVIKPLAVVVVAFVAGALLNPFAGDAKAQEPTARTERAGDAIEAMPNVPSDAIEEEPADEERTEDAATAAAAAFICNGQLLVDMTPDEVDAYLREVVTMASADRQVEEHLRDLAMIREALSTGSGPTVYRQGVLASRVEYFDESEARIALWHVGVLARADAAPPQAGWMISTVDLRWERGGWKVAGEIAVPGPAPILNDGAPPATADEFLAELDGFDDVGGTW